jgi:hypothetical protein
MRHVGQALEIAHELNAHSLIEDGEQRLVDVRDAPLATKMVRCRERSDVL